MNRDAVSRRIALISLIGGLGGGLVFPILPALGLQLGISAFMVGFILSANRIARLVFNVPAGHLIGRLGPRVTLSGALLIETVGVLGFSGALHFGPPAPWLLAGRFLFGIGTSFLMVGAQSAVLSLTDKADRGRKMATVRVAISSAVPAGLVLGGVIADVYSTDAAFQTGAGITFLGAIFAMVFLPPLPRRGDRPAQPGLRESLRILSVSPNRHFLAAAWGFNFMVFLTMQGVLLATMVILVQQRRIFMFGLEAEGTSGLLMAVLVGSSALIAFGMGRLLDRLRLRSVLVLPALLMLAAGYLVLALAQNVPQMLVGVVLVGAATNAVTLPLLALLGDSVDAEQHGPAVGIYQFFGDIGGTIGPILGIEVAHRVGTGPLYLGLALFLVLALPVAVWLTRKERHAQPVAA